MRREPILICVDDEGVATDAWVSESAPGLAAHQQPGGEWSVSHVRSGLSLLHVAHPEVAVAAMLDLAEVGIDWTLSGPEIVRGLGGGHMPPAVETIMRRHHGWFGGDGGPGTREDLVAR